MHVVFYKTNDVFIAEEKFKENGWDIKIVPTPVQDKAYCGVCVNLAKKNKNVDDVKSLLADMQYKIIL